MNEEIMELCQQYINVLKQLMDPATHKFGVHAIMMLERKRMSLHNQIAKEIGRDRESTSDATDNCTHMDAKQLYDSFMSIKRKEV